MLLRPRRQSGRNLPQLPFSSEINRVGGPAKTRTRNPDGAAADQARKQELAIIGAGEGVWSWVHIEEAAVATVAALTAPPGVYHVVDDDPSPVSIWLPAFARWVGAPAPPRVTEQEGQEWGGEDAVYYGTKLRGAANGKAKKALNFAPRPLQWLDR